MCAVKPMHCQICRVAKSILYNIGWMGCIHISKSDKRSLKGDYSSNKSVVKLSSWMWKSSLRRAAELSLKRLRKSAKSTVFT